MKVYLKLKEVLIAKTSEGTEKKRKKGSQNKRYFIHKGALRKENILEFS